MLYILVYRFYNDYIKIKFLSFRNKIIFKLSIVELPINVKHKKHSKNAIIS